MSISFLDPISQHEGKKMKDLCGNGYASASDNHCAHFVSHVLNYTFGYTCKMQSGGTARGANIRVHEVFARCPEVGLWASKPATAQSCLAFITDSSNVDLKKKVMTNVPKKHTGIFFNGLIWHYSNTEGKVVKQTPDEFHKRFKGAYGSKNVTLYYGTFPSVAS